jgi:hypothetical protein
MRAVRCLLLAPLLLAAVACTDDGNADTGTSPAASVSSQPTSDVEVRFVDGEWTYELDGVKATFSWHDGPASLAVKNGSEQQVGAPGLYVVTRDQRHVDGDVADAAPLDPSASGRYAVTFPDGLQPDDIGLVVLELGGVNWGALGPKIAGQ